MDGTPKKYKGVNQQVLKDFAVTLADSPNLSEKEILTKFPEFENDVNAIQSARDYWATVGDAPEPPKDIFGKFPEFDFGGTNPAEKKNYNSASSSGVGSSDLLSIKFGGEDYDVNPSTQEVFKGGKPIALDKNAKDYIAKNIIGVEPVKETGAVGSDGKPMQPIGATGAPTVDKLATQAIQKGLTGAAGETKPAISPDVRNVLSKNFIDVEVFDKADPAILDQAAKDLKDYTGTDVDLRYPETLDKAIGQAKILRDTDAFNKMAADASMTPKQAQRVANDYAAQKFLGSEDNELYRLQKQVDDALATADKEEIKKLQPLWEKAKKNFLDTYNNDITSLQKQIATGENIDGVPLSPNDISEAKKKLSLLQQQYVGFTQSPEKLANSLIKTDSSLSVLESKLKDQTPTQKLQTIANAYMARYFLLGKKLGIKTSDILDEGNIRFMTTDRGDKGLVEWSADNIKNYMGFGDLDGEVTSNDRREFAELHGKLKTLMPVLLINKSPIQAQEDTAGDIFVKTATQFAPATKAQNMTGQQVANTLQGILSEANVDNTELTPSAIQAIDTKLKDYGLGQSLAQMGGQTAQIVIPMMVSGGMTGAALETLALSPRTAWVARFLLNNPVGKVLKGAGEYGLAGKIANDSSELDLGTGAAAGAVDAALDAFGGRFKLLKPWLRLKFGKKAGEVASYIATQAAKGVGEFAQESGETIYQAWRDTPEGKTTLDTLQQQFGDLDDIVKFAIGTIAMGSGMSMASDLGFDKSRLDAVKRMTPEQRAKFDAAVTYFKDQDNQVAKGAIDEVLPTAKTEVLEDNIDDITTAKNKLQAEADKIQSEDDIIPYSVTVNGVTYSGATPQELRADLDYIDYISNKTNEELYKRKTETPPIAEADQTDVELAKPEAGVGVEGETLIKEIPEKVNLGQDVVKPNDRINKKIFIHETNAENIDKFDISKSGTGQGDAWLGRGIYLQEGGTFKLEKYGKNKIEVSLSPSSKIFEVTETPNGEFRDSLVEWAVKNTDAGKRKYEERLKDGLDAKGILPRDILKRNPEVVDKLKEVGYDGLYQDGELVVYNPDVLKINKSKQTTEILPQEGEVKETVEDTQVSKTTKLEEGDIATPEEYEELEKYIKEEERKAGSEYPSLSYKEEFIHKNIGRVDAQQLIDGVGEKVFKDGKMALRFTKKGGQPIDDAAMELSSMAGVKITRQDIFDYFVDRTVKGNRYVKQKAKNYKAAESIGKAKQSLIDSGFQYAANSVENVDELLNPDFIESLRGFPLTDEETDAILETIKKASTDENFKNGLKEQLSNVFSSEKTRSSIVGGQEETTPTQKVDEQGTEISQSPKDVTGNGGTDKNALPKEKVQELIKGGTGRKRVLESIAEPKVAEVAKILSDTKGIDRVMGILNNDDPLLFELQEKLGFKKIC